MKSLKIVKAKGGNNKVIKWRKKLEKMKEDSRQEKEGK
jgi:hypothetical protein